MNRHGLILRLGDTKTVLTALSPVINKVLLRLLAEVGNGTIIQVMFRDWGIAVLAA